MADPGDFQRGAQRVADQLIREAQEGGAFDHLPGVGKPILDLDQPHDENRWLRRWVQREQLQQPKLAQELRDARSR